MQARSIRNIVPGRQVVDGANVRLKRSIGGPQMPMYDPFLLIDEFKNEDVTDFGEGFPAHPHRGLETVTYMIDGSMEYADSEGVASRIGPGSLQWITAGSGVMHAEVPADKSGAYRGIQFWINLPAAEKMCRPRVQEVGNTEIPEFKIADGGRVRVIAGTFKGLFGPINGVHCDPLFLDVSLPAATGLDVPVPPSHNAFVYVVDGQGVYGISPNSTGEIVARGHAIVLGPGDTFKVLASGKGTRYLVVAAAAVDEPVVRYGPFVMSTRDQIYDCIDEFHAGTFIRETIERG